MQLIQDVIHPTQLNAVFSLKDKEVIYFREGAKRHLWIGKCTKVTSNGAVILFRNGVEQSYSMSYFRNHFAPAHWKQNQNIAVAAGNMNANYMGQALRAYDIPVQVAEQLNREADHAAQVSDLGEYYVWRIGGDIPKKIHHTMDDAVAEASRLAQAHPRCCFKVLHVAATIVSNPVTTYDTQVVIH